MVPSRNPCTKYWLVAATCCMRKRAAFAAVAIAAPTLVVVEGPAPSSALLLPLPTGLSPASPSRSASAPRKRDHARVAEAAARHVFLPGWCGVIQVPQCVNSHWWQRDLTAAPETKVSREIITNPWQSGRLHAFVRGCIFCASASDMSCHASIQSSVVLVSSSESSSGSDVPSVFSSSCLRDDSSKEYLHSALRRHWGKAPPCLPASADIAEPRAHSAQNLWRSAHGISTRHARRNPPSPVSGFCGGA